MDFTSTREPGNTMLHYYAFCFAWELEAAALSWTRQLPTLPGWASCLACSGTGQQRALYTHFSQQHNAPMRKGPVFPHCTNLYLGLANHIISWDRGCLLGQNSQRGGSHGLLWCLAGPSPPFISAAALQIKEAEKGLRMFALVYLQKCPRRQINTGWVTAQHVSPAK